MKTSNFETKVDFQPFVIQLEIESKEEFHLLKSMFGMDVTIPEEVSQSGVIEEDQKKKLAGLMMQIYSELSKRK